MYKEFEKKLISSEVKTIYSSYNLILIYLFLFNLDNIQNGRTAINIILKYHISHFRSLKKTKKNPINIWSKSSGWACNSRIGRKRVGYNFRNGKEMGAWQFSKLLRKKMLLGFIPLHTSLHLSVFYFLLPCSKFSFRHSVITFIW